MPILIENQDKKDNSIIVVLGGEENEPPNLIKLKIN